MKRLALRRSAIAAVILGLALSTLVATPASAATLVLAEESFANGATTPGAWLTGGSRPCLTAGSASTPGSIPTCGWNEPAGTGVLHFTDGNSQSGYAILDTPIDTGRGLLITFDMFQYGNGSGPAGGDGMAFMLIDGSVSPTQAGPSGSSIGYGSYGTIPGIEGGYVGVAFDAYGGFSNPGVGTGAGSLGPNSIAVRGSEATNYNYVTGTTASGPLSRTGWDRELARRTVSIEISSENIMSVAVDYGAGFVTELAGIDLAAINGAGTLPPTLKVGFSASTGGAWNQQQLQNFRMVTLAPDLAMTASAGTVDAGTLRGSLSLTVANDLAAGSTDGLVTVTSTVPAGMTPISAVGTGWACSTVGQLVTCTRSGVGIVNRLDAGESYPAITLTVAVASAGSLPSSISASVATADDSSVANDVGSGVLSLVAAAAPAALPDANGIAGPVVLVSALVLAAGGLVLMARSRRAQRG